jgi:hypothetical protein
MTERVYQVVEFPSGGWRVMEENANGQKIHQRTYWTRGEALHRAAALSATWAKVTAVSAVRKRAKNRCECAGECERGHRGRCGCMAGARDRVPGTAVVLVVVALNHHDDDLRLDNLRAYCQLCRQYHDADDVGADPLFSIPEADA